MSSVTDAMPTAQVLYDKEAFRAELEDNRTAFHRLVNALSTEQWRRKSPTTAWTTGEVLVHLTWALGYLPKEIEHARRGKGMFNYPKRVADPLSYWVTRWSARKATPASITQRYDAAMDAVLRALAEVQESDWERGAQFYGEGFYTIADLLHTPANHFAQHTAGM